MLKKKMILMTTLIMIVILSGCEGKDNYMSDLKVFFYENEEACNCIAEEASRVLTEDSPCLQEDTEGGYVICDPESATTEVVTKEDRKYGKLVSMLSESAEGMVDSVELEPHGVSLFVGDGNYILYYNKIDNNSRFPLSGYYSELNWERKIENGQIIYISDHRKDHESNDKGMYYRFVMEEVQDGIFISHLEIKYPWYSVFIG